MTPFEAAERLEKLPAAVIKTKLVELLEWQAAKGKKFMNIGWYLNCLFYAEEPRLKQTPDAVAARRKIADLISGSLPGQGG